MAIGFLRREGSFRFGRVVSSHNSLQANPLYAKRIANGMNGNGTQGLTRQKGQDQTDMGRMGLGNSRKAEMLRMQLLWSRGGFLFSLIPPGTRIIPLSMRADFSSLCFNFQDRGMGDIRFRIR